MLAAVTLAAACGASSQELVIVGSDDDGCTYEGPTVVSAGVHNLVIGPSGGGHLIATVHLIDTDVTPAEIVDHYAAGGELFPDFMRPVVTIERVNPLAFVTESHEFDSGEHVIVCVSVNPVGPDAALPVGFLTVEGK